MLSNLSISLAIDAYGPISDNAGGISEMSEFDPNVREKTDALDAAGNTTAAVGKGFAIGSACLVSLSLFGAFVTRTQVTNLIFNSFLDDHCQPFGAHPDLLPHCGSYDSLRLLSYDYEIRRRSCFSYGNQFYFYT